MSGDKKFEGFSEGRLFKYIRRRLDDDNARRGKELNARAHSEIFACRRRFEIARNKNPCASRCKKNSGGKCKVAI